MREFRDRHGIEWTAWEVIPASVERRRLRERRTAQPRAGERRRGDEPELMRARGLTEGWLTFESPHSKSRLTPIPPDWETRSDAEIEALLEQAVPVRAPRRLLE